MNVKLIYQNENKNTLAESITASFERNPKKVYFFWGCMKESGFRIVEEEFFDTKAKLFFAVGIDKKNTTRNMLESMLDRTKDVYVYSNNQVAEFDSNVSIFEYTNEAVIYVANSNISESGIKDDMSLYTEIIYDFSEDEDKQEYKQMIKKITSNLEELKFIKINKTTVEKLVEDKEIFSTRQYNHKVQSIAELLGKSNTASPENIEKKKQEIDDVYTSDVSIPKIDLSDMTIDIQDIDLSDVENEITVSEPSSESTSKEVEVDFEDTKDDELTQEKIDELYGVKEDKIDKDNELYDETMEDMAFDDSGTLDIGNLLFSKADLKLDVSEVKKNDKNISEEKNSNKEKNEFEEEEEVVQVKKVNLNNVTNFIFELPSRPTKGQDINSIRIPNYIRTMIPDFFELNEKGKNITEDGVTIREREIKVEVVDAKSGEKYTDRNARIAHRTGQTYFVITTDVLKNITYSEGDIIMVIKLAGDIYHLEIISKDMQEYKLWNKVYTQKFNSSSRKYGMM